MAGAAAREMESRGYRPSDTPDLLLDFHGKLEERMDIESTPSAMYGPRWGYGGWYGAPWDGGQEVRTRHYKVGARWSWTSSLTDAVARVVEGYPFVAGQSALVASVDRTK